EVCRHHVQRVPVRPGRDGPVRPAVRHEAFPGSLCRERGGRRPMSEMVHITVNRQPLEVPAGTRVIEAAKMLNIDIPHLCYHPDQTIKAHCRMCMVEVVGSRKLTAACSTVV